MHPIAERILAGENVCVGEILEHNARKIVKTTERDRAAGPHDPKKCKKANCTHNIGDNMDYAIELTQRAQVECTCGKRTHI